MDVRTYTKESDMITGVIIRLRATGKLLGYLWRYLFKNRVDDYISQESKIWAF